MADDSKASEVCGKFLMWLRPRDREAGTGRETEAGKLRIQSRNSEQTVGIRMRSLIFYRLATCKHNTNSILQKLKVSISTRSCSQGVKYATWSLQHQDRLSPFFLSRVSVTWLHLDNKTTWLRFGICCLNITDPWSRLVCSSDKLHWNTFEYIF